MSLEPTPSDATRKGVVLTLKADSTTKQRKPAQQGVKNTLTRDFRRSIKSIKNEVSGNNGAGCA